MISQMTKQCKRVKKFKLRFVYYINSYTLPYSVGSSLGSRVLHTRHVYANIRTKHVMYTLRRRNVRRSLTLVCFAHVHCQSAYSKASWPMQIAIDYILLLGLGFISHKYTLLFYIYIYYNLLVSAISVKFFS